MAEGAEGDLEPEHLDHVILEMEKPPGAAQVELWSHLPVARVAVDSAQESGKTAATAAAHVRICPSVGFLVDKISKKLGDLSVDELPKSPADGPSICRVVPWIREGESKAYEPKFVSIGPLHRGKQSLLPMEDVKRVYLRDLLNRSPRNVLGNYIRVVLDCEQRARTQYIDEVDLDRDEFVEMLVVDGCFIIEYFVKCAFEQTAPVPVAWWSFPHLGRDLMLLENQIPFFVLVKLFEHSRFPPFVGRTRKPPTLMEISLRFLDIKLPTEEEPQADKVFHLLHLYQLCMDPSRVSEPPKSCTQRVMFPFKKATNLISTLFFGLIYLVCLQKRPRCCLPSKGCGKGKVPTKIHCATELIEAGVRFKKRALDKGKVNCFIKAWFKEGTLEMPSLKLEKTTRSKLRNLIALEQCFPHLGSHFTSYAILMKNIVDTGADVAVLRRCGIIETKVDSDAEVAAMLNGLSRGACLFRYEDHYNVPLFRAVRGYCKVAHHRWWATLVHKYCSSPWTIISLLAGVLLLSLSAIQTYFTVFPTK